MNLWDEIRALRKMVAALDRKVATMFMTGTVDKTEGSKGRVLFDDQGADGKAFQSPMLSQATPSGQKGGGTSTFRKLGQGEPVVVLSPGGELGEHSRILPWGPVKEHPSPGKAEEDSEVHTIGSLKFRVAGDTVELIAGTFKVTGNVVLVGNFENTGTLKNNGVNVGSAHVHPGVLRGGVDTDPPKA